MSGERRCKAVAGNAVPMLYSQGNFAEIMKRRRADGAGNSGFEPFEIRTVGGSFAVADCPPGGTNAC